MSGVQNILVAEGVHIPRLHPAYPLDGLGANDPPVIAFSFGVGVTDFSFTYAAPTDGNQHRAVYVVVEFTPLNTRNLTLLQNGNPVVTFNNLGPAVPAVTSSLFVGNGTILGDTSSNWTLNRVTAVDGAVSGNLRIYTFGDATDGGLFSNTTNANIVGTPAVTVNSGDDSPAGSILFTVAGRSAYAAGRNFAVTNPLTYTYSPTGSAGVGLLTNGGVGGAALSFQQVSVAIPVVSVTWTFTSPQASEKGSVLVENLTGATY